MKTFMIGVVFAFSGIVSACSSYDFNGSRPTGNASTSTTSQTPAVITTSAEGAEAFSLIFQSKELLKTSTHLFRDLGFITQSQMVSTVSGSGTGACADYGAYDYTRTYNSNGTYFMAFTFKLCRQNDFQFDGAYSANGTPDSLTGRLSSGLTILNFKNNYATLIGSIVGSSLSFQMAGSGDANNSAYLITANGGLSAYDYYSLGRHVLTFSELVSSVSISTDLLVSIQTSTITASGKYSARTQTETTTVTYDNFAVITARDLSTNIDDMSMQGRASVDHTPNAGLEGAFDVNTATAVRTDESSYPPITTQGTLVTNSAATAQFGALDTIDINVAGDTPLTFAKEFILMKNPDFYAMEQQLPIVSGSTGTASGSIMSISALSTGPTTTDLACYTDVHVSYYNITNPVPADTILWYVHWNSGLSTCVPQANIPYQEATSSTGVATDPCDVGLDINGADQDITSGGVEHFLAANLPAGYYILSINNYSCATSVSNTATVLIGDYLFGPYNCTYTSADGDGSTPGAWCRLTDVRVNSDGSVDVIAPDASLVPWHP
jgi:hypothetical protein